MPIALQSLPARITPWTHHKPLPPPPFSCQPSLEAVSIREAFHFSTPAPRAPQSAGHNGPLGADPAAPPAGYQHISRTQSLCRRGSYPAATIRGSQSPRCRSASTPFCGNSANRSRQRDNFKRRSERPRAPRRCRHLSQLLCSPRSSQLRTRTIAQGRHGRGISLRGRALPGASSRHHPPAPPARQPAPVPQPSPAEPRRPLSNFRAKGARKPPPGPHRF